MSSVHFRIQNGREDRSTRPILNHFIPTIFYTLNFFKIPSQALKQDIEQQEPLYEEIMAVNKLLITAYDASEYNKPKEQGNVSALTNRWTALKSDVDDRLGKLNELKDSVDGILEKIKPVEEVIEQVEKTLEDQESVGNDKDKADDQLEELEVSESTRPSYF